MNADLDETTQEAALVSEVSLLLLEDVHVKDRANGGARRAWCDHPCITASGATTPEAAARESSKSKFSRQKRDQDS